MKLSDIHGERVFDVVGDLITPIANIAIDKAAASLFARVPLPKGENARDFTIKRVRDNMPILVKNHKQELCEIMAIIEGVPVEDYIKDLNAVKLVKDIVDLINDETVAQLFT